MNFREIQEDQKTWVAKNFPGRDSWMPLMGLVEEYGEYIEAIELLKKERFIYKCDENCLDALADMVIFLADYCSAKGFDLQTLWEKNDRAWYHNNWAISFNRNKDMIYIGKLCHHHLKAEQKIRGSLEEHNEAIQKNIILFLSSIDKQCAMVFYKNLEKEVDRVWQEVRQRDWTKTRSAAGSER